MAQQTLHMIGNAHIDPVWLWTWEEGVQETLATFRSALDRMAETPAFRFTASSAALYHWVERLDPAMFAEIQARVAEGRWELAGGWWIEPDCNIPGGESFARQALYGQRTFREKFGVTSTVGYPIDSFGHHAVMPQLLRLSGMDSYVFLRPGPHEKDLPGRLFWWEARDGSRVLAFQIPFRYNSWSDELADHIQRCAEEMAPPVDTLMCFYGVGNHGGGPTQANIASIQRLQGDPEAPALIFSTPARYFQAVRERGWALPVVRDELQHHASGCYAAHSGIKRWNRQAESRLSQAEALAALATRLVDLPYPKAALTQAWQATLFNQFHDILAGTSLEAAYDDARDLYGEALTLADRARNDAVQALAWRMAIPHDEATTPIVVFNPNGWPCRAPVELEAGRIPDVVTLTDNLGQPVPVQRVRSHATAGGRARMAFIADLPALGYRVYRLGTCAPTPATDPTPAPRATPTELENGRFRLRIDAETGYMTSLYDKRAGVEALAGPAARPMVIDDPSDTWSHSVFRFDDEVGAFRATDLRVVESGPVKATVRVTSAWGASTLTQEITLYHDLDRIDVAVTVDWHEQRKLLKLRFPVNFADMTVTHEIPYGHIERAPDGDEQPIQRWVDVSGATEAGGTYGLSVLNDGKPSVDVSGNEVGMTVLRSPVYAHHDPAELDPDASYRYIDQGEQTFTVGLYPHAGTWADAGTVRRAVELNQPPIALIATGRPEGVLPLAASHLEASPANIVVSALKQAEEGDDLILRAYESAGRATKATLQLFDRRFEAGFRPGEIKSWRIPKDPARAVTEVNFIEDPIGEQEGGQGREAA